MEPGTEIALKKLYHRAENLKPRDIFDVAVVLSTEEGNRLPETLWCLRDVKDLLKTRLNTMPLAFYEEAIEELSIRPESVLIGARSLRRFVLRSRITP
ncbi:hypothetical protein [Azospirillum halopraeferens]|uniref:hypothetical protein n=1 Tax=Azospirillum halopraeferens TaxID=34010 RepID=UPI000417ED94|nr:hypothetical protein [Azospirillum halopraeferens]